MRFISALLFVLTWPSVTIAADDVPVTPPVTYEVEGEFEDITFSIENAIINAGLVIENRSNIGAMLARTKEDVGGTKNIYENAELISFCSASVSRQVMETDPLNIRFCPYTIFMFETPDKPGRITVGHQAFSGTMAPAQEMMDEILADALMLK